MGNTGHIEFYGPAQPTGRASARQAVIDLIGVPAEQKFVQAGAVKTAYVEAGKGPPLLLLHGSGVGAMSWYRVIGALSRRFRTIVPDIVGFGESEKPSALYHREFFGSWLTAFTDALGLRKSNVVGHSLGGAIALNLALQSPERIERLVLVNSVGLFLGKLVPGSVLASICCNIFPSPSTLRWAQRYSLAGTDGINDALVKYDLEVQKRGNGCAFWLGVARTAMPFSRKLLSSIAQPTLLLWGKEDPVLPLANARSAQRLIPGARLHVIPQASHDPHLEQPGQVSQALIDFLEEPGSRPRGGGLTGLTLPVCASSPAV